MKNFTHIAHAYLLLLLFSTTLHSQHKPQARALSRIAALTSHIQKGMEKDLHEEGFAAGTPVHAQADIKPIELIQKGEEITSYDRLTHRYQKSVVTQTHQKKFKDFVRLYIGNEIIETTGDQRFLDEKKQWRQLKDLEPGDQLLTLNQKRLPITKIEKINQAKILYALSLQGPHNFAIGAQKLLTHNVGFGAYVFGAYKGGESVWSSIQTVKTLIQAYSAYAGTATVAAETGATVGGVATLSTGAAAGTAAAGAAGSTGVIAMIASNPVGWAIAAGGVIYVGVKGYRAYKKGNETPGPKMLSEILGAISGGGYKGNPNDPRDPWNKMMKEIYKKFDKTKMKHTIQAEKHGFQDVLKERGFDKNNKAQWAEAEEALAQEIQNKMMLSGDVPMSGEFRTTININGYKTSVRGYVDCGIPRVSTTYIEHFYQFYK